MLGISVFSSYRGHVLQRINAYYSESTLTLVNFNDNQKASLDGTSTDDHASKEQ